MIEIGTIKKVSKNGWCTVTFARKTACENCNMCLKPKDEMYVELKLKNTLAAAEGDTVSVQIGDRAVVLTSFIVYLIPLALVAAALGIASMLDDIAVSLGSAGGGLIVGMGIVALIDKKLKEKKGFAPQMLAIIKDKSGKAKCGGKDGQDDGKDGQDDGKDGQDDGKDGQDDGKDGQDDGKDGL